MPYDNKKIWLFVAIAIVAILIWQYSTIAAWFSKPQQATPLTPPATPNNQQGQQPKQIAMPGVGLVSIE